MLFKVRQLILIQEGKYFTEDKGALLKVVVLIVSHFYTLMGYREWYFLGYCAENNGNFNRLFSLSCEEGCS